MRRVLASLLLAVLGAGAGPSAAQTTPFDGDWALGDPTRCVFGIDGAGAALRIQGGTILGVENRCELRNPVSVPGLSAVAYDLQCTGEGMTWQDRALFMLNHDGRLVYLSDWLARILQPCVRMRHLGDAPK